MDDQAIPCPNCGAPILTEKFCPGCGTANPINYIDESVRVSKTRVVHRRKTHVPLRVMFVGAGAAVAVLIASLFASSYALGNMQFRIREVSDFDFATLSSTVRLDACNPTAFPAGFDSFDAVVQYQEAEFARMSIEGGSLMPYQSSTFDGKLKLSDYKPLSGLIIPFAIGGNDTLYNENDIALTITVDAKILGLAPYSESREVTFSEYRQFMSMQKADTYLCE